MESVACPAPSSAHLAATRRSGLRGRGLLPCSPGVGASFALVLVARKLDRRPRAARDTCSAGRRELRLGGLSVSGQNVTLSGEEQRPGRGTRHRTGEGATCATWIGRHTAPVSVRGGSSAPAPLGAAAAAPTQTAAQACERYAWRHAGSASRSSLPVAVRDRTHAAVRFSIDSRKSQNLSGHAAHRRPYRSRRAVGVQSQLEPGPRRRRRDALIARGVRLNDCARRDLRAGPIADTHRERSRTQPPH